MKRDVAAAKEKCEPKSEGPRSKTGRPGKAKDEGPDGQAPDGDKFFRFDL